MLNSENFQTLMHRSFHLDRALDIEIGVEYRKILLFCVLYGVVKFILGHLQGIEKVG